MDVSTENAITGAGLYSKLAALGNDSYTVEACERYAGMIAEIKRLKTSRESAMAAGSPAAMATISALRMAARSCRR